jgi:ribonuclease Z
MAGHSHQLHITGPIGIKRLVQSTLEWTSSNVRYPLHFRELDAEQEEEHFQDVVAFSASSGIAVSAHRLHHRVPSFGYVFEIPHVARFLRSKAEALGVTPGPLFGKLSRGMDVTLADASIVRAGDVTELVVPARKIVVLGDTCDSSAIADAAMHCDVLVHEATFAASLHDKALERKHSTSHMAGEFARLVNAKRMVLTHFSARYCDLRLLEAARASDAHEQASSSSSSTSEQPTPTKPLISVQTLVQEAQAMCNETTIVEAAMELGEAIEV